MPELESTVNVPIGPAEPPDSASRPDDHKPPREQRYRIERNEARAALEMANARIESLLRSEVERLAADKLSQPSDLFSLSGNDLADYLNEDGLVDAKKVAVDVEAVLTERPLLRKTSPAHDPSQGLGGAPNLKQEPSWGALLKF